MRVTNAPSPLAPAAVAEGAQVLAPEKIRDPKVWAQQANNFSVAKQAER